MKSLKQGLRTLLLVVSFIVSLSGFAGSANAASDYDEFLQVTPSLYVYTDGSAKTQKMDISTTWWTQFKQTYTKRVEQNIGWSTGFDTEFEYIRENGGSWGVFVNETTDGILVSIVGTRDPNGYCEFAGTAATGSYTCSSHTGYGFVRANYFTHNSYGSNGCYGSYANRCSDNGMNLYENPTVATSASGATFVSIPNVSLSSYKFYFMNFDSTYPSGYEGTQVPATPLPANYVAMGDSFSSGEGNPPFEAGTDISGDYCHRSLDAYPQLLQEELDLGFTKFVSCSGATTGQIIDGKYGEDSQIDSLTADTEIVTLTAGGNDVGFEVFATNCTFASCSSTTSAYSNIMAEIADGDFQDHLESLYGQILSSSGDAIVYVVGYPLMVGDSSASDCQTFEVVSDLGVRAVTDALNSRIQTAVNAVKSDVGHPAYASRLKYVAPNSNSSASPFDGNFVCSTIPYFYDLDTSNPEYSFHPNVAGHEAYKSLLVDAIG